MHDAMDKLGPAAAEAYRAYTLFDVLYADDTLILDSPLANVAHFAKAVEQIGATYGVARHWDKTRAMAVCSERPILKADGTALPQASSLKYLGSTLDAHGRLDSEVSGKFGQPRRIFSRCPNFGATPTSPSKTSCDTLNPWEFHDCGMVCQVSG